MHWIDWAIIAAYILVVTAIGILFIRRASGSMAEYFVAGRNLPWWLAGTSIVATSFAADTPLAITGIVADKGVAGNWLWWNQAVAWSLGIVFFARLWRRSGIITDAEFVELRFGGRPGAFLRGFKAMFTSVIMSTYTLAWVMLAMQKIVAATVAEPQWVSSAETALTSWLGWDAGAIDLWKWTVLIVLFLVATFYTVLSGFWGIVVTDLIQFAVAMVASLLFAIYAVDWVGGMGALKTQLAAQFGAGGSESLLDFIPGWHSPWMPFTTFAICLSVVWWSDCNGFAAQRLFSTRSERDSVLAAIWHSVAHFVLRPWPWIVVALVTLVHYPELSDRESGYPRLMMEILPVGLRGLMVASLLAAFMSTVDTHLNWNASYFVNDIYKRFWKPGASEQRCVAVSRLATIGYAALAIAIAYAMDTIQGAWLWLFSLQAGIGLVIMLRWFWWRINAWSEIAAMVSSLVISTVLTRWGHLDDAMRILWTAILTTPIWLAVTYLTSPADSATLDGFYRKVRPGGPLWAKVAHRCPDVVTERGSLRTLANWLLVALGLYAAMFAVGNLVLLKYPSAMLAGAICAAVVVALLLCNRKRSPFAV